MQAADFLTAGNGAGPPLIKYQRKSNDGGVSAATRWRLNGLALVSRAQRLADDARVLSDQSEKHAGRSGRLTAATPPPNDPE